MFHFQQLLCTAREPVEAHGGRERLKWPALAAVLTVELINTLQGPDQTVLVVEVSSQTCKNVYGTDYSLS
jgi:hypothetical protein